MLIDFTVENFRSIKDPVTLSAVAQRRGAARAAEGKRRPYVKPDHEIAPTFPVKGWDFELLPVLAIFGANASGKSNVLRALDDLLLFMVYPQSPTFTRGQPFVPFGLDDRSPKAPTRFELRVALSGTIYTYTLGIDRKRILLEHLSHSPSTTKRTRRLFERAWVEQDQSYVWSNGPDFAGPHIQLEESLAEREPFISLLVSRLRISVMTTLARWLRGRIRDSNLSEELLYERAARIFVYDADPEERSRIVERLRSFDTGIANILPTPGSEEDRPELVAVHNTERGPVPWPFGEESMGTRRLFALLSSQIHWALMDNSLALMDDLGAYLHPHITQSIVRLFQNPVTNPNRAQLIFTSHDNTLQRDQLLRRDQIWFTEKRDNGSTDLYSLSDFKVRNDLAIDRAYLDGRFGAVPILPAEEDMLPAKELVR